MKRAARGAAVASLPTVAWVTPLLAGLLAAAPIGDAHAHKTGLSRGVYRPLDDGARVELELSVARDELQLIAGSLGGARALDDDADGTVTDAEITAGRTTLQRRLIDPIAITAGGLDCPGTLGSVEFDGDGVILGADYACPGAGRPLVIDVRQYIRNATPGHRHVGVVQRGEARHMFLTRLGKTVYTVPGADAPQPAMPAAPAVTVAAPPQTAAADVTDELDEAMANDEAAATGALPYLTLGVEHILTGFDHLVFLLGLILVVIAPTLRQLVAVITAFTAGHSISLAVVALGGWAPSPSWVEPAIALSIAAIGVENLRRREGSTMAGRWLVTLPFGLLHGLGFGGALYEIGLPADAGTAALMLLCFNVGVELGQLAVVVLVFLGPLAWLRRARPELVAPVVRWASVAVVAAGLLWFVERVV